MLNHRLYSHVVPVRENKLPRVNFIFAFALLLLIGANLNAQQMSNNAGNSMQTNSSSGVRSVPVGNEDNARCVGFIQYQPAATDFEVVGGEQEQERRSFWQGDYVYLNAGAQQNVSVGQEFSVVRPHGKFNSKWSRKKGTLGTYMQEVARVRVVSVKSNVSVAQVVGSCELILRGDFLRPVPQRTLPMPKDSTTLDRFSDPNGKAQGRIVLARDLQEALGRDQVVYIDLGAEDSVKVGDSLTIFRPVGTGNITRFRDDEVTPAGSGGFESDRYRGGKYSNEATRVKNVNGGIYGKTVGTADVNHRRPAPPRKVVGEMTIVDVQQRTATAVITRVVQEVNTGDYVEVQ